MSPLLRLLLCSLALTTYGQGMSMSAEEEEMLEEMGIKGAPMGRKNLDPQAAPFKSDLKYIYCGVCRKMVEQAHVKAQEILTKRFEQLKKKKRKRDTTEFDGEGAVQEFTEKMCNPLKPEGEWVGKIDLTQEGDKLVLASQPEAGKCKRECRTVEAACNEVLDRADTEFTEILYKAIQDGNDLEQVQRYICNRAAGVCKKKTPPLKGTRKHDERFHALTAEEKQMQDMQANLKETGMSGTMYRREDLAGMMDKMKDFMPEGMGGEEGGEGSVNPAVDEEGDVYDQESGLPIVGESKEEL
mmetsp:Transcript_28111/g.82684  ORF Transcript_28111/g.82684 Transcript_28111/m.82684 type:complete len:299 (+) Transcript_28111:28-924(+)